MTPPHDPNDRLIQAQLRIAQQALSDSDFPKAENALKEALEVKGEHPNREDNIRQLLKSYSDELLDQPFIEWKQASQAQEMICSFKLENEETKQWWRELKLAETNFLLGQAKPQAGFQILNDLIKITDREIFQESLDSAIVQMVQQQISTHAKGGNWGSSRELVREAERLWQTYEDRITPNRAAWLETIKLLIDAVEQSKKETLMPIPSPSLTRKDEQVAQAQAQAKQWKSFTLMLSGVFVIAALAYGLLLWQML